MALIKLENVSKVYGMGDATTFALDDVSLNVEKGEFVAIMGPSGSGKSTLLNMIGLLDRPSAGSYMLDSRNVSRLRSRSRAKVRRDKIGFIFQNFNLLPKMTVIENVALPLAYRGMTHLRRMYRASEILERLELKSREYYYPTQLSGGQLQKVAIARALVNRPSLIIADEPTGNLDSASSRAVMELLKEIHKSDNTIIMVTHNPDLTEYANRVVYMIDGKIHQDKDLKIHEKADITELHNAPSIEEEQALAKCPPTKKTGLNPKNQKSRKRAQK
jgi:putative ABC transport system ATP-binding protein